MHQAPFTVLKEAEMPAVVVEVGYSTHAREGKLLTRPAYHKRLALGMVKALIELDDRLAR